MDELLEELTKREMANRTMEHEDPVIQRALKLLGQAVNPVQVVEPQDYNSINLPGALHDQASKAVGFRVWRGEQPDEPIFVNKKSTVYDKASNPRSGNLEALLLASTLAHEQIHDTERGEVGEGAALRKQADFLRSKLKTIRTPDERRSLEHYLRVIDERANQRLK